MKTSYVLGISIAALLSVKSGTSTNEFYKEKSARLSAIERDLVNLHIEINDGNFRKYGIWMMVDTLEIHNQYRNISADIVRIQADIKHEGLDDIAKDAGKLADSIEAKTNDEQLYKKDSLGTKKYQTMVDDIRLKIEEEEFAYSHRSVIETNASEMVNNIKKHMTEAIIFLSLGYSLLKRRHARDARVH